MSRKSFDLALVCGHAALAAALVLLGVSSPPARVLLGLPLVLISPGYALTAAVLPRRTLASADRALFTLGLSLCATILCGFVLNRLPWGLRPDAWSMALVTVTLGASIVALGRRLSSDGSEASLAAQRAAARGRFAIHLSAGQWLLIGLAIAVVAGAVTIAHDAAAARPSADVIQLWMLPANASDATTVRVGITSVGEAEGSFRLQIARDGYLIREWPDLAIAPGQSWETTISLAGRQPGSGPFEARLYRHERPDELYRRVAVWPETREAVGTR